MRQRLFSSGIITALTLAGFGAGSAHAQSKPWDVFIDGAFVNGSECGLINGANVELAVISSTGELTIVSGTDRILLGTFVDGNSDVFFDNDFFGTISFADDGDGFRTLWWLSGTGRVMDLNQFTLNPDPTDFVPSDFNDVPCDVCDFWDDPTPCLDPVVNNPPVTFNFCGSGGGMATIMMFAGLAGMGLVRRRRW